MIRIFKYIEEFDCFVVDPEYKKIADLLGLAEWNEVVWIGRYFALDNDYGEHWFDNWHLREQFREQISRLGVDETEVFFIDPERFSNGADGPCHNPAERKQFWTDVLKSLQLSLDTLFAEARHLNEQNKLFDESEYKPDLESRIAALKKQ